MQYHPKDEVIRILKEKLLTSDSYEEKFEIVKIFSLINDKENIEDNLEFYSLIVNKINHKKFIGKTLKYKTPQYMEYLLLLVVLEELARLEDARAEKVILESIKKFKNSNRVYDLLSPWYKYNIKSKEFLNELMEILDKSKERKNRRLYNHLRKKYFPKESEKNQEKSQEIDLKAFHKSLSSYEEIDYLRKSESSRDRKKAVGVIKKLPRDLSIPLLLQIFKDDKDVTVKQAAFNALTPDSIDEKITLFKKTIIHDTNENIRASCCLKLERIQGEKLTEFIVNVLKEEKNTWVKTIQIRILGRINTTKSIDALKELLAAKPEMNIKREIVYVFGLTRKLELAKLLLKVVFEDKRNFVRTAAIKAILRIGDESSVKILRDNISEFEDKRLKHYLQRILREYDEIFKQGYKFGIYS